MKYWTTIKLLGLAVAALAFAAGAQPTWATMMTCSEGNVSYSLDSAIQAACFSGNDTNQIGSGLTVFGSDDWILADKSDDDESSADQNIFFTDLPVSEESSANWALSLSSVGSFSIMVTLKQASGFGAFLIDATSGTWSTWKTKSKGKKSDGKKEALNGLSHSAIYYLSKGRQGGGGGTPVPGPGAAGLLLLGMTLLGMGVLLRRQRS